MIKGIDIKEVFDYRLSTASVFIDRRSGAWVCVVASKNNPDHVEGNEPAKPLETYDTGIKVTKGDAYDTAKIKVCFEWFLSIRDKYALPNIEELKPHVAKINAANKALADLGAV